MVEQVVKYFFVKVWKAEIIIKCQLHGLVCLKDCCPVLKRKRFQTSLFQLKGDVAEAVRHARTIRSQIRHAQSLDSAELFSYAKELRVPFELLQKTAQMGRLPVVNFAAGGLGKYGIVGSDFLLWVTCNSITDWIKIFLMYSPG